MGAFIGFLRRVFLALAWLHLPAAGAYAADKMVDFSGGPTVYHLSVPISQSVTLEVGQEFGDIVVANDTIADAQPMTNRTLYVIGKAFGTTNINLFTPDKRSLGIVEIEVGVDTADLAVALRSVAPHARLHVTNVNGRVRLSGVAPDAVVVKRILEVAGQYAGESQIINAMTLADAQQVNLEVRVLEVNRNAGRDLGISFQAGPPGSSSVPGTVEQDDYPTGGASVIGWLGTAAGAASTLNGSPFGTLIANIISSSINVDIIINALEAKNLARRLAEPNLTTLSGEPASFLAGGEVPVQTVDNEGNITTEYKNFGVELNFTPVVLDDGVINLKLNPRVSELGQLLANNNFTFTTRELSTTVELRDGQSFALAGLLQSANRKKQSQLPWIGQVPILGALFRSSSFVKDQTDLVVIVTPHIVSPAVPGEKLATPLDRKRPSNDPEFFLLGMMEVDDDLIRKFESGEGIAGPYGHILEVEQKAVPVYVKK